MYGPWAYCANPTLISDSMMLVSFIQSCYTCKGDYLSGVQTFWNYLNGVQTFWDYLSGVQTFWVYLFRYLLIEFYKYVLTVCHFTVAQYSMNYLISAGAFGYNLYNFQCLMFN